MEVRIKAVGFDVVINKWRRAAKQAPVDIDRTTEMYAGEFLRVLATNASGRPGPRRITGSYLNSWFIRSINRGGRPSYSASTRDPRAKRLEKGFMATDSLGRHYNQPPYPHILVSVLDLEPKYIRACQRLPRKWYR